MSVWLSKMVVDVGSTAASSESVSALYVCVYSTVLYTVHTNDQNGRTDRALAAIILSFRAPCSIPMILSEVNLNKSRRKHNHENVLKSIKSSSAFAKMTSRRYTYPQTNGRNGPLRT